MLKMLERLFEMSQFRLFLSLWTAVSIAVLIFIANQSFKPELSAPAELISSLNVTRLNTEDILRLRTSWPAILRDIREVEGLFQALKVRQTFRPIELKMTSKQPLRFQVESDQVEIGISYALAPGQVAHALLQNWFLQNKPVQNFSERLQQVLYADIFWAAAHGQFELGLPDSASILKISKTEIENANLKDVLLNVASTETISNSIWAPQEMRENAKVYEDGAPSRFINPVSLRKFLLSQVIKSQGQLSLNARIEFLKNLLLQSTSSYFSSFDHLDIEDLCDFVNTNFSEFGVDKKLNTSSLSADALFASEETLKTAAPSSISYIVQGPKDLELSPGHIILSQIDLKKISVHTLVVSVKKLADVQAIESAQLKAKKILAIHNPKNEFVNFESLKFLDFNLFATRNKKIQFAVFDQESLGFATKKKLDRSLSRLLEMPKVKIANLAVDAETLGIATAQWDSISQTYHVDPY